LLKVASFISLTASPLGQARAGLDELRCDWLLGDPALGPRLGEVRRLNDNCTGLAQIVDRF
jgi:hypothetical protein